MFFNPSTNFLLAGQTIRGWIPDVLTPDGKAEENGAQVDSQEPAAGQFKGDLTYYGGAGQGGWDFPQHAFQCFYLPVLLFLSDLMDLLSQTL
jgi:hypothetical protein